jgi:tungstate transport system substrate-binding protein
MLGKETRMRHLFSSPVIRRATVVVVAAVTLFALAMPAVANAVAVPKPTISISTRSMNTAAQFKLGGKIAKSAGGKILVVEVKKPGSTRWSYSSNRGIAKNGTWSYRYMPRLKGTYQFRARFTSRYGTRVSSVVSMWLKTQPVWDIYVASTTSTTDSGLFETLVPLFQRQYPYWRVKVLSLGSIAAIQTAYDGASDMLFTHEPVAEAKAVLDGKASDLHSVMYNDFLLVGPVGDPAGIRSGSTPSNSIVASFETIRTATSTYVTRSGASGTAVKNMQIWALTPSGTPVGAGSTGTPPSWYIKLTSSTGMGAALIQANNYDPAGYILTDRATWLNVGPPALKTVMCENDPTGILKNPYSVSLVTNPKGNAAGAVDFSNWLRGSAGQAAIGNFGVQRFGKQLFIPWVPPAAGAF